MAFVVGTLVDAHILEKYEDVNDKPTKSYEVVMTWNYIVGGFEYRSDNSVFSHTITYSHLEAENHFKKYAVGQSVKVYFDPLDPRQSTLDPGIKNVPWGGWILFLVYVIGVTLAFYFDTPDQ
ncbi:DUF3592 domain-containing protein [Deinococcus sp. HMF7620]|uniref:DUF3592 domain-containing protein n=1 Tax=Deinococcus arboris TaxID=2682977 RepID=A0A7C9I2A6_9DEIO|nr:DUF3592 domain-containing protein [Deinococcus arboris]MVN89468.1 DUF3592 domain-containing protein [Deinococcus arboris]